MAYIRIKKINQQPYAYLVESKNTSSGPRQKVKQYLGRVYSLNQKKEMSPSEIKCKNSLDFLRQFVTQELKAYGFKEQNQNLTKGNLSFSPENFTLKKKNNQEAILALQEGYLCSFTLQRLQNFQKTQNLDQDAYLLAEYFLEAGFRISQEQFVHFYLTLSQR